MHKLVHIGLLGDAPENIVGFLHSETPRWPTSQYETTAYYCGRQSHYFAEKTPKFNPNNVSIKKSGGAETSSSEATKKLSPSVCRYWMNGNCTHGDQCWNLHSWFHGEGFSTLAKLHEHKKMVTGIALPDGSDKLFSGSTDGTVRIWDCRSGRCIHMMNLGGEVRSLMSEGPWVFVGLPNAIKAWNIHTAAELTLDGPKGHVLAMVVGHDTLFAGAKRQFETRSPFELVATLNSHTAAVVCLTVGRDKLYSGSMDHSIKMWDLDTLHCTMTLNQHTDVVTSLLCWDQYLLSSSSDKTVKVWAMNEMGTLEVIYTHNEEHGVIALGGITDSEEKPILFCSTSDHSVGLYELPSFSEGPIILQTRSSSNSSGSWWSLFHWRWDRFVDSLEMVRRAKAQAGIFMIDSPI